MPRVSKESSYCQLCDGCVKVVGQGMSETSKIIKPFIIYLIFLFKKKESIAEVISYFNCKIQKLSSWNFIKNYSLHAHFHSTRIQTAYRENVSIILTSYEPHNL